MFFAPMMEYQPIFPPVKLQRPFTNRGWVVRPRLLELLDQVLYKPVAVVSAPAGFGKTTLIAQWLDRCQLPNAWLQIDEDDYDIPAFMAGIAAALRQLFPNSMQTTSELVLASGTLKLPIWKNGLINDLELLEDTPFVLVLDDYHLIRNPAIDLLLTDVLRSEALPMRLIISARRSPPLSFSRLRVQNQIVEISTANLRFTDAETALYFSEAAHVSLSSAALQQLQEKTEGWAAGLALALISLREKDQPEELIAGLEASENRVNDYLLDQVFNCQPPEIQEFLLKTATFNQFCAPMLCEAFGGKQSEGEIQSLLERIEAMQLFLIPLDSLHRWYRYHHLFRKMLLAHQRVQANKEAIAQFHRRAATWFISEGQLDEALTHLLAISDWAVAAQLVERQLRELLNTEDYQGIKRRLGYFPEDFIAARPGLLLLQLWIAHFAMRIQVTQLLNARIQEILDNASMRDASEHTPTPGFEVLSHEVVQAQVWAQESICYYLSNQGSQAISLARQAFEHIPQTWRFIRGNAMIYYGLSLFMEGQYDQAIKMLQHEYESLQAPGSTYGARLLFCRSAIYLLNGEIELCRQSAEQLLHDSLAHNLLLDQGWSYYLLGRVYQEWNQLELAAEYFLQGVEKRFTMNMMPALECIAGYAYILQILDRGDQAQQFLSTLGQLHGEQTDATPPALMALTAWLNLENGRPEEARRWAETFKAPVANQSIIWYHIPHLYKIRILMGTDMEEAHGEIDQLFDEIIALAERTHNTFTQVRILALHAVWLARCGDNPAARQTLKRALRLGRPGWFIHSFVKQGSEMLALLLDASGHRKGSPGKDEYIAAILSAFERTSEVRAAAKGSNFSKSLLTERELEVLKLLAERLSINEISNRLCISPSTVQQHSQHISSKKTPDAISRCWLRPAHE